MSLRPGHVVVLAIALSGPASAEAAPCPRGTRATGAGCVEVKVPDNAELNLLGTDWTCRRGYRRTSDRCVEVQVPANAELNFLGNDWTCVRGFRRVAQTCLAVKVPENAELNYLGNDWSCRRGYQKVGAKCDAIKLPTNAEIDYLGNGWQCKRGFRRSGPSCAEVQVPENAGLDFVGNNWTCNRGYRRVSNKCVLMSERDRLAQERLIAAAQSRARRVNSSSCEIDGKRAKGDRAEVIVARSGCRSYFIADGPNGEYLLEWYGGHDPSEGDILIGPIDSYGFADVCYADHGEGRVYVDDYNLTHSRALEKLAEKCN